MYRRSCSFEPHLLSIDLYQDMKDKPAGIRDWRDSPMTHDVEQYGFWRNESSFYAGDPLIAHQMVRHILDNPRRAVVEYGML